MSVRGKNINSWISDVKQNEENMANEQSQNGKWEYQIDEIKSGLQKGLLLMIESRRLWTLKPKLWPS